MTACSRFRHSGWCVIQLPWVAVIIAAPEKAVRPSWLLAVRHLGECLLRNPYPLLPILAFPFDQDRSDALVP